MLGVAIMSSMKVSQQGAEGLLLGFGYGWNRAPPGLVEIWVMIIASPFLRVRFRSFSLGTYRKLHNYSRVDSWKPTVERAVEVLNAGP